MNDETKAAAPAASWAGALGHPPADKRLDILRLIGQSGSISQAARDAGVSYKAAWQAVDTLTNLSGVTLVTRAVGGSGGGGARLTDAGLRLLAMAQRLDEARRQVLQSLDGDPASAWGLRTSMRNQLPGQVTALARDGQIVRVQLRCGSSLQLASRITRESAELLALKPGCAVLALCKATAVHVHRLADHSAQTPAQAGQCNRFEGRATRVSSGTTGDEVALALESGLQLVGFAAPGSGIRKGVKVLASFDEAALVLAVTS